MFTVKVITPDGLYAELEATILDIMTPDGMRGILSNHMPLVTMISVGKMTIGNDESNPNYRYDYATGTGMLYFHDNLATVLVESVERSDEIDLARAEAALERSVSRMAAIETGNVDIERAKRAYRRAKNRISIKIDK
ncbi:ATP synthase epsilon chain [bioreactor metagenome]|uniref:ATP synthase epsilon chain n=1 Tax=bioreactor metagenome TaxID=1076179 RepID=A0A644ZQI1_9ZZZZ|nr:F0F1 ATP synthase subunit epsilon [Erysipelotrichaceae bacterium]